MPEGCTRLLKELSGYCLDKAARGGEIPSFLVARARSVLANASDDLLPSSRDVMDEHDDSYTIVNVKSFADGAVGVSLLMRGIFPSKLGSSH